MPLKKHLKERISELLLLIDARKLDGYMVPSTDEFLNEYVPVHLNRLKYISGFTGSNGLAIITKTRKIFITDSRYTLQASKELVEFEVYDFYDDKLNEVYSSLQNIGYDPRLLHVRELESYQKKGLKLTPVKDNLIDAIWQQDAILKSDVLYLEHHQHGQDSAEKIATVTAKMTNKAYLITDSTSVCWLLNIRGNDVLYNPIVLSKAIIHKNGDIDLFTDADISYNQINIHPLSSYYDVLSVLDDVAADASKISVAERDAISEHLNMIQDIIDPIKACKNEVEIKNFQDAHLKDGIALTKALYHIHNTEQSITEYEFGELLLQFRKQQPGFFEESFAPIVGYAENGAIIHYQANKETARYIGKDSLLLIDSGGHYLCGTTDVTRTIHLGEPKPEHKKHFTLVLKGLINLSLARFPEGTNGSALDVLARGSLWAEGLDYGHSTSHGVGASLSVHESPPRIGQGYSAANKLALNMVLSNEPGYYREGEYGIRIENLMFVSKNNDFLKFETLTLVPIQMSLIDKSIMHSYELEWLNTYNKNVCEALSPHMTSQEKEWLVKYSL